MHRSSLGRRMTQWTYVEPRKLHRDRPAMLKVHRDQVKVFTVTVGPRRTINRNTVGIVINMLSLAVGGKVFVNF